MPQFPDPLIQQFPAAILILGTVWLVVKWVDRRHGEELLREKSRADVAILRADAEVARVREDKAANDRMHAAELQRTAETHAKQVTRLQTRVRELERHLEGDRP